MTFTESNTIEAYLRDLLTGGITGQPIAPVGLAQQGLGWHFLPGAALGRQPQEVFSEPLLREALIRLNPEIAAHPERADEVLYKLRAIVLSVRSDGLIRRRVDKRQRIHHPRYGSSSPASGSRSGLAASQASKSARSPRSRRSRKYASVFNAETFSAMAVTKNWFMDTFSSSATLRA